MEGQVKQPTQIGTELTVMERLVLLNVLPKEGISLHSSLCVSYVRT